MRNIISLILLLVLIASVTGCTPALTGAIWRGDVKTVTTLLDKGADINARTEWGDTPLHAAVGEGNIEIVKILLNKGADVNAENNYGSTPLMVAARDGHTEIAKLLLERTKEVDVKSGVSVSISSFGEGSTPVQHVQGNETALIMAAKKGYVDIVKALLEKGANVNEKDVNGDTALIWAEKNNHPEVNKLLREAKAKWKPRNDLEKREALEDVEIEKIQKQGVGDRFRISEILPQGNAVAKCSFTITGGNSDPASVIISTEYPKDRIIIPFRLEALKTGSVLRFKKRALFEREYTFEGDENEPLSFMLLQEFGLVYVTGKGKVTLKNGKLITLP